MPPSHIPHKYTEKLAFDFLQIIFHGLFIKIRQRLGEFRLCEGRKRARIAGVIYNRLQKGMLLQIDATVLYSLGEHRETVTYKDLEVDSPYNTYKHVGLPPGPIASPGQAAIDAALNPEANNYYYYVAKGDGSHYFSATYTEHLEAVQKYGK